MRVNVIVSADKKIKHQLGSDNIIKSVYGITSDQIDKWVDDNATDIDSIKQILKSIIKTQNNLLKYVQENKTNGT